MKNSLFASLLVVAFIFFSCSNDDASDDIPDTDLIGSWNLISATTNGAEVMLTTCDLQTSIVLTTDMVTVNDYNEEEGSCLNSTLVGTYTSTTTALVFEFTDIDLVVQENYTYTISGNDITLTQTSTNDIFVYRKQ